MWSRFVVFFLRFVFCVENKIDFFLKFVVKFLRFVKIFSDSYFERGRAWPWFLKFVALMFEI